ncbi:MAG TPA: extracellular solute-binding protein [Micropepsaceae bacterium]|jgi:iron(III) transport system substrate-binding protein|nr:extracellular solute-binding protein [Micropepsaceae bacterium]
MNRRKMLQAAALTALLAPFRAWAAAPVSPAQFSGPDRIARLIAGAKKEGFLNLYSSAVTEHMSAVMAAFEKKYGVKVRLWRGGSEEILQRAVTEARGNRFDVDVMETASPQIIAMAREKLLQPVQTPIAADLMPDAIIPNQPFLPSRLIVFTGAYNTNLIAKSDLPKTYADLANPKWKGKLGIETDDNNWLMAMAGALGEDKALALFRDIVTKNGISVRKGHTLMANLVASGEVPMALTIYYHEVEPLKRAGAPIQELNIAPVFAFTASIGVAARAPHPNAAVLFQDFLLSDGQKILADRDNLPANVKFQRLPKDIKLTFFDVPKYMDQSAKWTKLYKDILSSQKR